MTSVLIVDDQALIRSVVSDLLSHDSTIEISGHASNGQQAVGLALALRPDVVLMDIRMPIMDGIEATSIICSDPALSETRVLILTTFEEDEYLVTALRAGASGFIGKGSEPEDILHAIHAVHAGETLLSPTATRALVSRFVLPIVTEARPSSEQIARLDQLTQREREILVLVARGLSNQQIAQQLTISPHTAKTHVTRVMGKAGAHDRAQLVILAYETGLLSPGD